MKIEQVSDSVHVVTGSHVNWALVSNGAGLVLIDAGYPADAPDVLRSIRQIGHSPADLVAVLLTHAHLDHTGAVRRLVKSVGTPVYTGAEEARHARREYRQQISPAQMLRQVTTARGRRWVAEAMLAARGRPDVRVPSAAGVDEAPSAALPRDLVAIPTPGHTDGHTAYLLAGEGVLFSGDALITGHPLVADIGPQPAPKILNHDDARARNTARLLAGRPARTLVPGHGTPTALDPAMVDRLR